MSSWWHEQRVREPADEIWGKAGRPESAAQDRGREPEVKRESEGVV